MRWKQFALALIAFALALVFVAQWRVWEVLYGYLFAYLLAGVAVCGVGLGLAVAGRWRSVAQVPALDVVAGWSALGIALVLGWECKLASANLGAVVGLVVVAVVAWAPWGLLVSVVRGNRRVAALLVVAVAAGLLLASAVFDRFHGPVETSWLAGLALAGLAVVTVSRWQGGVLAWTGGGALVAVAFLGAWNARMLPEHEPGQVATSPLLRVLGVQLDGKLVGSAWLGSGRTDFVRPPIGGPFYWVYSDGGAPVAVPSRNATAASRSWWERHLTLTSLAAGAAPAGGKAVWIAPVPGASAWAARAMGRPVTDLAFNRGARRVFRFMPHNPAAPAPPAGVVRYAGAGQWPARLKGSYGLIGLTVTGPFQRASMGPGDSLVPDLVTDSAIRRYWARLAPGGVLAIICQNEPTFARVTLSAWQGTAATTTSGGFLGYARGYRATHAYRVPERYLLLLKKPGGAAVANSPLDRLARTLPVEALFGGGAKPLRPYGALSLPTVTQAAAALHLYFSDRARRWVSIGPTTAQRPFLFQFAARAPAATRWILGMAVTLLLAVLLLPLPELRRGEASSLLVPVYLSHFALVGAGLVGGALYLLRVAGFALGAAHWAGALLLAALVAGAAAVMVVNIRRPLALLAATFVLASASAPLLDGVVGDGGWLVGGALAVGGGLLLGLTQSAALAAGFSVLAGDRKLVALRGWAWLAYGSGGLGAAALAPWLAMSYGWWLEGLLGTAVLLLSGATLWFMARAPAVAESMPLDVA